MSEYKYELDTQSRIVYAWQQGEKEGRKEGEKEGRKEGHKQGRKQGRKQGHKEGRQEEKLEILKLFDAGCSAEEIKERLKADSKR
jgi:flagellar biosynthesis/type III secretory pathway protein FliH